MIETKSGLVVNIKYRTEPNIVKARSGYERKETDLSQPPPMGPQPGDCPGTQSFSSQSLIVIVNIEIGIISEISYINFYRKFKVQTGSVSKTVDNGLSIQCSPCLHPIIVSIFGSVVRAHCYIYTCNTFCIICRPCI